MDDLAGSLLYFWVSLFTGQRSVIGKDYNSDRENLHKVCMAILRIKTNDCSPLGREVLRYMKENNVSMNEMAKQTKISQPSLRAICLGESSPTEITLRKLASVMQMHPVQLYLLAYENHDDEPDAVDKLVHVLEKTIQKLKSLSPIE